MFACVIHLSSKYGQWIAMSRMWCIKWNFFMITIKMNIGISEVCAYLLLTTNYIEISINHSSMHCFPARLVHFFWSMYIAYINNLLYQMHCYCKCNFSTTSCSEFLVLTHNGPGWLSLIFLFLISLELSINILEYMF